MSKETTTRLQDINGETVAKTTFILSIIVTFFATLVVATVANWFLYGSIHTDARAAVVQDMQLVSKEQSR